MRRAKEREKDRKSGGGQKGGENSRED